MDFFMDVNEAESKGNEVSGGRVRGRGFLLGGLRLFHWLKGRYCVVRCERGGGSSIVIDCFGIFTCGDVVEAKAEARQKEAKGWEGRLNWGEGRGERGEQG